MATPLLSECVFVIDKSIPLKKKVELIKMIKANGGASVYSVSPKATHLITTQDAHCSNSSKVDTAKKFGIHIVSKEFVVDSISQGIRLSEEQYYFSDQPISLSVSHPQGLSTNDEILVSPSGISHSDDDEQCASPRLQQTVQSKSGASTREYDPNSESMGSSKEQYLVHHKKGRHVKEDKRVKRDHSGSEDNRTSRGKYDSHFSYYEHDDGCKIFVGGIMLDDIDALRNTKDGFTDSPDVIAHIQKLKQERLLEIIKIFNRYGTITRVKQFLDNRHIFISFDTQSSAIAAIRDLQPLENRKRLIQDVRERLRIEGRQSLIAPRVNFYVRWPNKAKSYYSESDRHSGRSDSEGSWRRRSSYGLSDTDPGYGSNSSALSQSEYESESDQFSPRYLHPNHRYLQATRYESDGSDGGSRPELRLRRAGLTSPTVTTVQSHDSSAPTGANTAPFSSQLVPNAPRVGSERDWLWLWSKVIILFQVVAIMAIVYFYNRGGF